MGDDLVHRFRARAHQYQLLATAGLGERREGGLGINSARSYTDRAEIEASSRNVYEALTTLEGISGWWTASLGGGAAAGDELVLTFPGVDEQIVMRIDEAVPTSSVIWTCLVHTGHPEWERTTLVFEISDTGPASCTLALVHIGLVAQLRCYAECERGWQHFVASLVAYVERGEGRPFTGAKTDRRPTDP